MVVSAKKANVTVQVEEGERKPSTYSFAISADAKGTLSFVVGGVKLTASRAGAADKRRMSEAPTDGSGFLVWFEGDYRKLRYAGGGQWVLTCESGREHAYFSLAYFDHWIPMGDANTANKPEQTPIDAGPSCVSAEAPEKPLKLEVGKRYKRRDGHVMRIAGTSAGLGRWFVAENGSEYHEDGRWAAPWLTRGSRFDLIEEMPEQLKLELGKYYKRRDGKTVRIVERSAHTSGSAVLSEEFTCELGVKYWSNGKFARSQETALDLLAEDTPSRQTESRVEGGVNISPNLARAMKEPPNEASVFGIGAAVRLKAGGPAMTVIRRKCNGDYICAYGEKAGVILRDFPSAALVLAPTVTPQKDQ